MVEVIERIDDPEGTTRENLAWHLARYQFAAGLVRPGAVVLDAASGVGYGARPLASAGARVVSCDLAPEAVRAARLRREAAEFARADLHHLPYRSGALSGVVCFEVLEHLSSPAAFLDEVVRVLDADGWLVVSTPNPAFEVDNPFHQHELSLDELDGLLRPRFTAIDTYGQPWSSSFRPAGWGSRLRDLDVARVRRLLPASLRNRLRRLARADGAAVTDRDLSRAAVTTMPLDDANPYVFVCRGVAGR